VLVDGVGPEHIATDVLGPENRPSIR
jgi:hypothetical protein